MRVIAGSVRGMKLAVPLGLRTRPTADRVREALFSIITSRRELEQAQVLDICAGTGSLGIEALSRGAGFCCFVEQDRRVLAVLEKNLEVTGFIARSQIIAVDCLKALRLLVHGIGALMWCSLILHMPRLFTAPCRRRWAAGPCWSGTGF